MVTVSTLVDLESGITVAGSSGRTSSGCTKRAEASLTRNSAGGFTISAVTLYAKPNPRLRRFTFHWFALVLVHPSIDRSATIGTPGSTMVCSTKFVSVRGEAASGKTTVALLRTRVPGWASALTFTEKLTLRRSEEHTS